MRQAGLLGARPVGGEFFVGVVAPFGGLDPNEFDAAVLDRVPVDLALVFRNVNAVNGIVAWVGIIVVDVETLPPPQPARLSSAARPAGRRK